MLIILVIETLIDFYYIFVPDTLQIAILAHDCITQIR